MLQGIQAVVAELGDVFTRGPDPEYATFLARFILVELLTSHDRAAPGAAVGDITESTVLSGQGKNRMAVLDRVLRQ
ncbi:hypothetical protein GCM10009632_53990 [Mycolicibacterium alvei]|uniref:Uncharacterized protein n=1 Tax=Mycolicibacterium alvei TaxID=67081 RepID=A0A6N4UWK6_9MYCO|nr:hypothetical protein MALV_44050 [Mycolicibacterium alvei]